MWNKLFPSPVPKASSIFVALFLKLGRNDAESKNSSLPRLCQRESELDRTLSSCDGSLEGRIQSRLRRASASPAHIRRRELRDQRAILLLEEFLPPGRRCTQSHPG